MLNIPDEFWQAETRNDFLVPESMKRAWAIQLTMLDQTLEIAKRHNIRVWVDYGTLLGTVRHKGYIPWDDDADVCVMRADYLNLIRHLKEELPDYCNVYSFYSDERCDQPKGFISNRSVIDIGTSPEQAKITSIYYSCPYVTGLDLYPMDYVPADPGMRDYVKNLYIAAYSLAMSMEDYQASGEFEGYLSQLEGITGKKIKRDEHLKNSLWRLADSIAMMTKPQESGHVIWYPHLAMGQERMLRKKSWFKNTLIMPFEMLEVPVPEGYNEILTVCYTDKYMTPKRAKSAHGYPFYAEQERKILLHNYLGKMRDIF